MTQEPNLRDDLLKQNGIESGRLSHEDQMRLRSMTEKENARLKQMRRIMKGLWIFFGAVLLVSLGLYLTHNYDKKDPSAYVTLIFISNYYAFWLAFISSMVYIVRSIFYRNNQNQRYLILMEDTLRQLLEKQQK